MEAFSLKQIAGGILTIAVLIGAALALYNNNEQEPAPAPQTQTASLMSLEEALQDAKYVRIKSEKGEILLELYPKIAPRTVENFISLVETGFYNGLIFHRVVPEFVIQGGDPNGDGSGGPGYQFEDEINARSLGLPDDIIREYESYGYAYRDDLTSLPVDQGAIAMANAGPNTNGSQFFIVTHEPQPHLFGLHTVFGRVVEGMNVVLSIEEGDVMTDLAVE